MKRGLIIFAVLFATQSYIFAGRVKRHGPSYSSSSTDAQGFSGKDENRRRMVGAQAVVFSHKDHLGKAAKEVKRVPRNVKKGAKKSTKQVKRLGKHIRKMKF
jgi:hypothetical protein